MNEHLSVFYKRLTATVVMLAILFTSLPWIPVSTEVAAASTVTFGNTSVNLDYGPGSYFTDNGKACTDHGTKGIHSSTNESACNCKCKYNNISLGACQCFGYARYIQTVLFESNSFSKPSNFYEISGSYVAAGNLTATKLKNLMTSGEVKPGAHIRTNDGTSSKHSLIVTQITDSGFSIIQANGSNNNEYSGHSACRVGTYTYTWNSYVSSTYGKRGIAYIEMPREYTLPTNNYVNLGTGFYAVILNTNYWKPISYDTDGFIRLQSETGTANQVWRFDRQSDGSYVISNAQNGYALEMYYGNTTNGNPVAACSKDWGGYYQRWYIYQQGNGYILLSKHYSEKNLVLDLSDNNSTNGTPIITWPRHNGSSQIWSIYKENDVQIKSPTLNVSVGTSATNTKFTWSESYGEYSNGGYPLKIWKNKLYEGDAFHIEWEAKSGYSINLPAGTYQAYVDARNHFECKQSNVVTFTVKAVAPKAPQLTLSKTSLAIGEKVTVSWTESPGATYYWIECWHKGEHCINRSATVNPEILSFDDEGKYAINIIASNEAGGAISNVVEFYVGKYTISYNSNGGTGAPSNQTKNNGIDLTLSSSKPTKSYKITYNANGGSVSSSSKTVSAIFNNWKATDGKVYKPGDKYTANSATTLTAQWTNPTAGDLPTPTRTGYTFNGWYTAASGGNKITSSSAISANTTIYAQWTQIKYTVSFNANGGSGAPGNQTKIYGTDLTLSSSKPTKSYKVTYNANGGSVSSSSKTVSATFNNWKATDGKIYKPGDKYTANSATTLTAQWTNPTAGDLPTPTRTGYSFNGWYTAASGGSKITSSSTISANITLYAQWTQLVYLDLNGSKNGSSMNSISGMGTADVYINGQKVSSGTTDYYQQWPVGTKYEIKNIQSASGYKYVGASSYSGTLGTNRIDVILPFQSLYTILYNANGGSGAPGNQTKVHGTDLTLSSSKPTKSYKITYNANGGSVSSSSKTVSAIFNNWKATDGKVYKPGDKYTANSATTLTAQWTNPTAGDLPTPTRTGYSFNGWYTAASGGTKVTSTSTISANTTLYAQWTQLVYLDLNGSKNGSSMNSISGMGTADVYVNGQKVSSGITDYYQQWPVGTKYEIKNIQSASGYKYVGASSYSGTLGTNRIDVILPFQSLYTILYNANGGSGAPGNQTKVHGTDLTLSSSKPTKSYKITYNANGGSVSSSSKTVSAIFNNWKATDGKVYKPGDKYTANSATTLTAQWTNPTAGDLPTPTRTGYTFNGWYTAASGGSKITSTSTISANTTIYAQWTQIKYTVSFNANGGSGAPGNQTKIYGTDLTLSSSKPAKSYKITYNANGGSVSSSSKTVSAIFNNWKATDGKVYKPGDKYTANSATTLTAQWTNPTAGDLPTPTRTGYTFNGWYTAASGGIKITSTSTISANTTIYAQWTQIKYTVSFNSNGGTGAPGSQTMIYGTDLTLSSSKPAKSYKITYNANGGSVSSSSKTVSAIFNNWKATDGKVYKPGDKYTTNSATTLTAQWTNPTAGDLPTPTRTGYTFNGWYTAASGGSKITSSSTISANTTIYAQWSANPTTTKSTTTTKATTTTKPTTTTKATTTTKPTTTTKATTTTKPTTTTKATTTTKPTTTTKATTTTKPTTTTKATTTTKPTTTTKATTTTKPTTTTKATTTTKPTTTTKATTTTKPTTTTKATTTTKPTTTTKATTTTKPTTTTKATTTAKPTTTTKATTTTKPTTTTTTKPTSSNGGVYRLSGSNRCKTAVEISKSSFKKASNVILASGDNYADALAGVPLADALDAPILLVRNHKLDDSTRSEIKRLGAKNIYILGGNAAIGENISSSLSSDGYNVTRVSGRNRFDTAVEIAEKLQSLTGNPREVFFAYSHNYPDALAISGIAAIKECPVLYIAGNGKLNDSTLEFLRSCGADKGTILGGTGAISADAEGNIENAGLGSVKRIAGKNRYDTCLKINKAYASVLSGDTVCVATGTNFPDALAGGVFASRSNAPLLLVGNDLNSDQKSYLSEYNAYNVYVFGGSGAVSEKIFNAIERIINQ